MSTVRSGSLLALSAAISLALGACASTGYREGVERGNALEDTAAQAAASMRVPARFPPYYEEVDAVWIGSSAIVGPSAKTLPDEFKRQVVFRRQWPVTLSDISEFVTASYGLNVSIAEDAMAAAQTAAYDPVETLQRRAAMLPGAAPDAAASMMANQQMQQQGTQPGAFRLQYDGTLEGFLDRVAARTGNAWRYEAGRILIYHTDTKIFRVDIQAGESQVQASVSSETTGGSAGGGGGGGGASGGSQSNTGGTTTQASSTNNPFQTVVEAVQGMLSPKGKVTSVAGLGQVVVTDVPAVLERVDLYIKSINEIATRQVVMDVKVYSIEKSAGDSYGISWDAVWQSLGSQVSANILSAGAAADGASALDLTVVDSNSPFNESQLLLEALSREGNLQQVTTANLTTLSGRAVPVQVSEETSYLASTQVTLVPDAGAQVTRTPGLVTTGFSMMLKPMVTSGDELLLEMQINLSSLREIRRIGSESDGSLIESPLVDSRQILQNVHLNSGQTLVVAGFEQESIRNDARGIGNPKFMALGGNRASDRRSSTLVVLLTPRVVL